jgi:hypothetical protein
VQELSKRQAGVLDRLASQDSIEQASAEQRQRMLQEAVQELFGGPPGAQEGKLANGDEQAPVSVEEEQQEAANGSRPLPGMPAAVPSMQDALRSAADAEEAGLGGAADGAKTAAVPAAQEQPPTGMRRKRSVACKDGDISQPSEASANPLKRGLKGGLASTGKGTGAGKPAKEQNGHAPLDAAGILCDMLCGLKVDRVADVFIAWSEHIRACDAQEVQGASDDDDDTHK